MIKMNLKYLLDKNKISQKELSEATNIPKNTMSKYYNNTWISINKEHLNSLCNFFDCDTNDIFEYSPDINENFLYNSQFINDPMVEYKSSSNFYNYINKNLGKLTEEEMQFYAMSLSAKDSKINYSDALSLVTQVNNQYKKQ